MKHTENKDKMVRMTVSIPEKVYVALAIHAEKDRRRSPSMAAIIIEKYLSEVKNTQ